MVQPAARPPGRAIRPCPGVVPKFGLRVDGRSHPRQPHPPGAPRATPALVVAWGEGEVRREDAASEAYCGRFTGITTYMKSLLGELNRPGLFDAFSSSTTSFSSSTFSTSVMNVGLNEISMSSPS